MKTQDLLLLLAVVPFGLAVLELFRRRAGADVGAPTSPVESGTEPEKVAGVILSMEKGFSGWEFYVRLDNATPAERAVLVRIIATNRWNAGFGEQDVIDVSVPATVPPNASVHVMLPYADVAVSFLSQWDVALYLDGQLADRQ